MPHIIDKRSDFGTLQTNDTIDITDRISPVIDQGFRFATGAYYRSFISRTGIRKCRPISPAGSSQQSIANGNVSTHRRPNGQRILSHVRSLYLPAKTLYQPPADEHRFQFQF